MGLLSMMVREDLSKKMTFELRENEKEAGTQRPEKFIPCKILKAGRA